MRRLPERQVGRHRPGGRKVLTGLGRTAPEGAATRQLVPELGTLNPEMDRRPKRPCAALGNCRRRQRSCPAARVRLDCAAAAASPRFGIMVIFHRM
jgi:hypothetical protein